MALVTYNSVAFVAGSHQRQPRSGSGGFVLLQSSPGGDLTGSFIAQLPKDPITVGVPPETFAYSFMTVSGGSLKPDEAPVGVTSFDPSVPPQRVFIGAAPVNVLIVYVPKGGSGLPGTGSGATIDQLDDTSGHLLNDTFVTVAPDLSGALTNSANVEGFVDRGVCRHDQLGGRDHGASDNLTIRRRLRGVGNFGTTGSSEPVPRFERQQRRFGPCPSALSGAADQP